MARILDAVEVQLSTDFAILKLEQVPGSDLASGPYATSTPGTLAMTAGTKYSDMDVRVERWDAEPPPAEDEWEDRDVLPWRSTEGSVVAQITGFDPAEDGTVSLRGLERARVEILAWGRNRYHDWPDAPGRSPRERWLLRLWPDLADLDALAGPPRRLIGRSMLPGPTGAFRAAVAALRTSGWWPALAGTEFGDIFGALSYQHSAFRMDELPRPSLRWAWDTEAGALRAGPLAQALHGTDDDRVARIGRAAGIEVRTYSDALAALVALGVFAVVHTPNGELLVPNPTPPISVWDIVEPVHEVGYGSPEAVANEAYRAVGDDLLHLARWARDGVLHAAPERIASRLGLSLGDTLGALRFLAGLGHRIDPRPDEDIDTAAPVSLSIERRRPA